MALCGACSWVQATFDPSQGWTNALIFLFLSNGSLRMFHTLKTKARRKIAGSCCCHSLQSRLEPCIANGDDKLKNQVSYQVVGYNGDNNGSDDEE